MIGPLFKSALWHAATLLIAWAGLPVLFDDPAVVDAVVVVEVVTVAESRNLPNAAAAPKPLPTAPPPAPGADPAPVEVAALAPPVAAAAPAPQPEPAPRPADPMSAPSRPAAVRAVAPPPPPDRAAEAPAPQPVAPRAPMPPQPAADEPAAARTDKPPRPDRAAEAPDPAPARADDAAAEPDRPGPETVAALAEPAPPAPPPRTALLPEDVRRPARKPPPPRPDDSFESALDRALEGIDDPEPAVAPVAADETAAPEVDPIARLLASEDAARPLDERLTMTEVDAIRAQIESNWEVPAGAEGAHEMTVTLRVRLEADGRTVRSVIVEDRARVRDEPFFRAMADSAVRAVKRVERLENLSPETYRKLRDRPDIVLLFNPRDMFDE